jgi:SAP domain-containing new25
VKLSTAMSVTQFEHGYWYATELKAFAKTIGIPSSGPLRKDELEAAITRFLRSGTIDATGMRRCRPTGIKDVERGLRPGLRVRVYTNDAETKAFLEREALKLCAAFKRRSGVRYRLNRWREQQIAGGVPITYRDLVREYVRLSRTAVPFARIAHGRYYVYFLSDFLAAEAGATHAQAIRAWKMLKTMDVPKDYRSWAAATSRSRRSRKRRSGS